MVRKILLILEEQNKLKRKDGSGEVYFVLKFSILEISELISKFAIE